MKIAFLILCHKNPSQINLLINKLLDIDCEIYIHIDKKNAHIRTEINTDKHIFILSENESYSVDWGGISIIYATLNLIKYALKSNKQYDYFCLLSGQDFPIRPMDDFIELLQHNPHTNYINLFPQSKYNRYKKLYELPYPKWINKNTIMVKVLKNLYKIITGGYNYTFPIFRRRKPFDFDFYFGSQWWCLTFECLKYILDYYNGHPEYVDYFEKSIIPDECFFQTLFMASPFRETRVNNLTFVNWGSNHRSPEVLTKSDYEKLNKLSNNYFFARKFDCDVDKDIINYYL